MLRLLKKFDNLKKFEVNTENTRSSIDDGETKRVKTWFGYFFFFVGRGMMVAVTWQGK